MKLNEMRTIAVTFPTSSKQYHYKSRLDFVVGEQYYITNDKGSTYRGTPVRITSISRGISDMVTTEICQARPVGQPPSRDLTLTKVIFNNGATICYWSDGTKTVVRCDSRDAFVPETGIAMCYMKRAMGNTGRYNDVLRKFVEEKN